MSEYNTCFFQHGPACRARSIARFKINTQNSQLSLRRITFAEKDAEKVSTYARWYAKLSTVLSPYSQGIIHSAEQGDTHTGFTYEKGTKCPLFPKLCRPKTCDLPWFFLNFVREKTFASTKLRQGDKTVINVGTTHVCRKGERMQKGRKTDFLCTISLLPNTRIFEYSDKETQPHSLNVNS